MNTMAAASIELIREKFKTYVYKLYSIPNILYADFKGVFVHESAPYPDIVFELDNPYSETAMKGNLLEPRLKAKSYGDWEFSVIVVPANYFESRDQLEERMMEKSFREVGPHCISASEIPIREAMKAMKVDLSTNLDYCLNNKDQIESDLNCKIPHDLEMNNELAVKRLEQEIFYKMMCKIFGRESADDQVVVDGNEQLYEKSFLVRDFSILSFDGNGMIAAATRGDYYLLFFFEY